jgi:hypothetical protein
VNSIHIVIKSMLKITFFIWNNKKNLRRYFARHCIFKKYFLMQFRTYFRF